MKKLFRTIEYTLLSVIGLIIAVYVFLWIWNVFAKGITREEAKFGVTFSSLYAEQLGLDWKETYVATLDDLGVKRIRIPAYWPNVEPENGAYNFEDLDFQINEAASRNVEIILAVGQKLPRWPECHIPNWARESNNYEEELLGYIETTINRYKNVGQISHWQIENEPFLKGFGDCKPPDEELLDREIALAKSLDQRPILITDSGELGDWVRARNRGDVFGTTMYRFIWNDVLGKFHYPLPPTWFKFKDFLSRTLAGGEYAKKVIVIEMQAEAWGPDPIPYITLEQQFDFMDFDAFKDNIKYAEKAGFPDIYLWGVEWWYWLDTTQGVPEFWEYSKTLF